MLYKTVYITLLSLAKLGCIYKQKKKEHGKYLLL